MLGGTLSTSPARLTMIVASLFVKKTKTTLRTHTVDKNTSSCAEMICVFGPKHGGCSIFSIYRVTQFL